MSKLGNAQDRALELIGELGTGIRKAVPGKAMQWVETGAALGAVRTGTRIAGRSRKTLCSSRLCGNTITQAVSCGAPPAASYCARSTSQRLGIGGKRG